MTTTARTDFGQALEEPNGEKRFTRLGDRWRSFRRRRNKSESGQSLLLIPAGFLILLVLGSLVLEAAAIHLRQRQLDDLADSIANDAVAVGFDVDNFRLTGDITIDLSTAQTVVGPAIAISNIPDAAATAFRLMPGAEPGVEVELTIDHEYIIGRNFLGGGPASLTATGRADLVLSAP